MKRTKYNGLISMLLNLEEEYQYFSNKYDVSISYIKSHSIAMHNKLIDNILFKKAEFFQIVKDILENENQYNELFVKTLKEKIEEIDELEDDLKRFQELLNYQNLPNYGF